MKAVLLAAALLTGLLPGGVTAAEKATAADAVAMVQRAVALIRSVGRERAFAAITDPANRAFHDRDLYVYVYDLRGVALAHGNNLNIAGTSRINMKDNEGRPMIKEMVEIATTRGKGWVEYNWPNPVTKQVELKSGYIERVDDMLVGSGIYR